MDIVTADNSILRIAYGFKSNLWQLRQGVDSLLSGRALDYWPGGPDSIPTKVMGFFSA